MAFGDVDCIRDGGGDGQRDSRADLECGVELCLLVLYAINLAKGRKAYHSTTQTLNINRNGRQDEGTGSHKNKRYSGNADQGGRKDVDPEVRLLIRCGQGTRDGSHDSQDKTCEQRVFSIDIFQELTGSHRGDEADCAHGKEAEGGVTGVEIVHLLGHQDDVVDDVLVASITSFDLLAHFHHSEVWGGGTY